MKKLEMYDKQIDTLDVKIVRLFEQRMCTVKKKALYRKKHDMIPPPKKKRLHAQIVQKATETACDTEVIAYTEGLIQYILTVSEKFFRKNRKKQR